MKQPSQVCNEIADRVYIIGLYELAFGLFRIDPEFQDMSKETLAQMWERCEGVRELFTRKALQVVK